MSSKKLSEEMKLHLINFHGWLHFLSIAMTETGFAGISLLDNAPYYLVGCVIQKRLVLQLVFDI